MFDGLAGIDMSRYLLAIGVVGLGLMCLFVVMWVVRNKPSSPFVRGGRARQPRLAVVDAAAVDTRRRIILVRRDNVEHLIMIGGPTDIVIESRISAETEARPDLSMLSSEEQSALPKTEAALELPAPASVTEHPVAASAQTQSAPPLKAKMWPTEAKSLEPVVKPAPEVKSQPEPLAFQPPTPVSNIAQPLAPIAPPAPLTPAAAPFMADPIQPVTISKTTQVAPELEIRNPYLEAETAAPAPNRVDRPATSAPAPVSAMHKWLRPAQADKPKPSNESVPGVATREAGNSTAKPEPVRQPATKPVASAPVDINSLISSDFLDAARSRVLETPPKTPGLSVSAPVRTGADIEPSPQLPKTKNSEFAKILDDEIKTGLPESRFDIPRVDQTLSARPTIGVDERLPFPSVSASDKPIANASETQQARKISDILDGARARVLQPSLANTPPEIVAPPVSVAALETPASQAEKPVELVSDAFALEFEKIWEKQAMEATPNVELGKEAGLSGPAPEVSIGRTEKQLTKDLDIFGMDLELDPDLQPSKSRLDEKMIEAELSLDDEMARVLGEFSISRKN